MSSGAPPDLSIVIVNRNTRELLRACLRCLAEAPDAVRTEVIVVDNGSADGSVAMVESAFPQVRLIRNPANTGFAYPNNQGLAGGGFEGVEGEEERGRRPVDNFRKSLPGGAYGGAYWRNGRDLARGERDWWDQED